MPRVFNMLRLSALLIFAAFVSTWVSAQEPAPASTPAPATSPTPASTPTPAPQASDTATAQSWVKFGIDNGMKGDLTTAIENFNQAMKVDPDYAPAYQCRGHALAFQNKLDDAIADYTKAIALDPKFLDAYYDRAVAHGERGEFDAALADFNKTLELNPNYSPAYYNRGHVKYFTGDLNGSIADLNEAVAISGNTSVPYFIRGLDRRANLDRQGAAADFQQSFINGYADAALWEWITKTESGDRGVAQSGLNEALGKSQIFKPDDWTTTIGNFLLNKITQDQLMTKAKTEATPDRLCEAWFYIGMSKRFSGDSKGALDSFQQALATGAKVSEIYIEAQREVTKLQKN